LTTVLAVLAATAWLFLPGAAVGLAAGMRGLSLAALAPALTLAALGGGSVLAPLAGLDWGWGAATASAALGVVVARLVAWAAPIRAPRVLARWTRRSWLGVGAAGAAAAAFTFGTTLAAMGGAGGLPQSWDLVYHGNLTRFILDTANASPFHAGVLNSPGAASAYYPSGVHAVAALAPASTQVWPALNMVWLVAGSAVWILGLVYLARVLFPHRPAFAAAAAALGVLYQGQPTSMVGLVANGVGVALLPALLGWSVQLARVVTVATGGRVIRSLILLVAVVGGAFAHPGVMFSYAVVASPIALYIVVTVTRRGWRAGYRAWTVLGLAALAAVLALGVAGLYSVPEVRAVVGFGGWSGSSNVFAALALGLTDATTLFQVGPNLLVLAGLGAGAWVALRRRSRRWLILSFGAVLVLYVGAVAKIKLLEPITGLFYSDRTRLGPLLAVAGIPLILWGLDWILARWRAAARNIPLPDAVPPVPPGGSVAAPGARVRASPAPGGAGVPAGSAGDGGPAGWDSSAPGAVPPVPPGGPGAAPVAKASASPAACAASGGGVPAGSAGSPAGRGAPLPDAVPAPFGDVAGARRPASPAARAAEAPDRNGRGLASGDRGRGGKPARRHRANGTRAWIGAVAAVGLASAGMLTAARPFRMHAAYFDLDATGAAAERRFFDRDEFQMIGRLAGKLDPDAAVLGDPANGSAFLYSVIGQPVVFPHITGSWDGPRRYLKEHFGDLGRDPEVCAALAELGVEYVYLDSETYRGADGFADMTKGLVKEGNLELVDRGGSAEFYRVTACGGV
jgi:hypothetical protein